MRRTSGKHRGHALVELLVVGGLTTVIIMGVVGLLGVAGRQDLQVNLFADVNEEATHAMRRIQSDIREASSVEIVAPDRVRFYYPVRLADGRYDRTKPNPDWYMEYFRGDDKGKVQDGGEHLVRRSSTENKGTIVAEGVTDFSAAFFPANADNSVRFTLRVRKDHGTRSAETRLDQRVLYMRNYYGLN